MLSLRTNNMRPVPSLIGESQGSVSSETDRGSMMSEMGHLERMSSAGFSTGSSRMSAGYGSNSLTPELSMGSQMGLSAGAIAGGLEHKVSMTKLTWHCKCCVLKWTPATPTFSLIALPVTAFLLCSYMFAAKHDHSIIGNALNNLCVTDFC